ncbi:MAG: S-layer homology domain-containing protein [Oscillospiraceae bacterium]|jgi:hypothetical protein|nr:S-layer homology domain-containing protein [Oscillospiraceae bacterium]
MKVFRKKAIALLLSALMCLSLIPGAALASNTIKVIADLEGYNLGQGFYVEPAQLELPAGSTAADATVALLEQAGLTYSAGNPFYLSRVNGIDTGSADTPDYITNVLNAGSGNGSLGEFDYSSESGWMVTVNHTLINTGADAHILADGDVIRWQFTVQGYGADLGLPLGFGSEPLYTHSDKTELLRALFAPNTEADAKAAALDVIINPEATAEQITTARQAILATIPIVIETTAGGQVLSLLQAKLVSVFGQSAGSYDYSVVKNLKISGTVTAADYTAIRNASYAGNYIESLDLSGVSLSGSLSGMTKLKNIILPNLASVATSSMFSGDAALESVTVGAATTSIGVSNFFNGCTSLATITFLGSKAPSVSSLTFNGSNNATAGSRVVTAIAPDKTSGGYNLAAFTQYFADVQDAQLNPPASAGEFAALSSAIEQATGLAPQEALYSAASWSALQGALSAAQTVSGNAAATSGAVNEAKTTLLAAISALAYDIAGITVKVTHGATVGLYYKVKAYVPFDSFPLTKIEELSDDEYDLYSAGTLANKAYHIEAFIHGQTTKVSKRFTVAAGTQNQTITIDLTPLSDFAPVDNTYMNANVYTNLPDSGTLDLSVGETFDLDTFRVWQAMDGQVENYFIEPDYTFELFGDAASIAQIGAPGRERLHITAAQTGVAVIKITYSPVEYYLANGNKLSFNANSDSATGVVVINVGGGAAFDTGLTAKNDFDIIYFDKTEGVREYTFTPANGTDVRVHDPLNTAAWGSAWTAYEADDSGTFTVALKEGRNIVELKNGGATQYYVLRAKGIDVTVTNTTNPGLPLKSGDTAEIKLLGIETGIEKLATIYNPGFGTALAPQIKYTDGAVTVESAKGGQYASLTTEYKVNYTITDEDSAKLSGQFWIGVMGDPIGSHRAILLTGRDPNFSATAQGPYALGDLPELDLCPAPEPGDTVTVFTTYQTDDTGFAFLNEELAVPADISERYGYSDAYRGAEATALDALVAVHIAIYGDGNLDSVLAVNKASGSVTTSLGGDAMADGFSFLVNHVTPYDSTSAYNPSYGYTAYTIREAKLSDSDRLQFVNMRDSYWMDYAAWFENSESQEVTELSLLPGEEAELALMGFYAVWYSTLGPDVYESYIDTICESNILTLLVEDEDGYFSAAVDDYITTTDDGDGTFTLSFANEGVYYITAGDTDWGEAVVYPLLKVTVAAPVITITAQPQNASVTEGSISGSLSVTASVAPSGTLSYQWYTNTTAANTGGSAIDGATSASLAIPAALAEGKYYYYVVISVAGAESVVSNAVTVTVAAKQKDITPPDPKTPWQNPFIDVAEDDWFYKAVEYASKNKLMSGVGDSRFDPNGQLTRGMVVTILARSAGAQIMGGEYWWSLAREWGMANGVTDGTNMESAITREQFVMMIFKYAQLSGIDTSARADISAFTDSGDVSFWAVDAVKWAVSSGLIKGKTATEIKPTDGATRAEAATILMKYLETVA